MMRYRAELGSCVWGWEWGGEGAEEEEEEGGSGGLARGRSMSSISLCLVVVYGGSPTPGTPACVMRQVGGLVSVLMVWCACGSDPPLCGYYCPPTSADACVVLCRWHGSLPHHLPHESCRLFDKRSTFLVGNAPGTPFK